MLPTEFVSPDRNIAVLSFLSSALCVEVAFSCFQLPTSPSPPSATERLQSCPPSVTETRQVFELSNDELAIGELLLFCYPPRFFHWTPSSYAVDGRYCNCMEQFLVVCKASLLDDDNSLAHIMHMADPRAHKHIGRHVHGLPRSL